ncbi:MAG: hypothetical protein HYU97_11800 [Deltaproteobacteria bacterium]|nr:hypothetical protein [Deltaproteobacteria bacterium]
MGTKIAWPLFDINLDGTVFPEEIYTVRTFHEVKLELGKIIPQLAETPRVDQATLDVVVNQLLGAFDAIEAVEAEHPAGVTPVLGTMPAGESGQKLVNFAQAVISNYRQYSPAEREYFKSELKALKASDFNQAGMGLSKDILEDGQWISTHYVRMELNDGAIGLSEDEFKYYELYYADYKTQPRMAGNVSLLWGAVPKPDWDFTNFGKKEKLTAQTNANLLKQKINIEDPALKTKVEKMINTLASVPTGAKLLADVVAKHTGSNFQIRLLTEEEKKIIPFSDILGQFFHDQNALGFNGQILNNLPDEILPAQAANLAHELLHSIITKRPTGDAATIKEEELCNETAQLVLWELGLSPVRNQGPTIMSPTNRWFVLWHSYSPRIYGKESTAQQVATRESAFSFLPWRNYIDQQRAWLMNAALSVYN